MNSEASPVATGEHATQITIYDEAQTPRVHTLRERVGCLSDQSEFRTRIDEWLQAWYHIANPKPPAG